MERRHGGAIFYHLGIVLQGDDRQAWPQAVPTRARGQLSAGRVEREGARHPPGDVAQGGVGMSATAVVQ